MTLSHEDRQHFRELCQTRDMLQTSLFIHKLIQNGQLNDGFLSPQGAHELDTPLIVATVVGDPYAVELLVESGADINVLDQEGSTPLYWACFHGEDTIAEYLLRNGADPNILDPNGIGPLSYASENEKEDYYVLKLLLQYGVNVNALDIDSHTVLFDLFNSNRFRPAEILLEHGASITQDIRDLALRQKSLDVKLIMAQLINMYTLQDELEHEH